jgi:hypothetical protein
MLSSKDKGCIAPKWASSIWSIKNNWPDIALHCCEWNFELFSHFSFPLVHRLRNVMPLQSRPWYAQVHSWREEMSLATPRVDAPWLVSWLRGFHGQFPGMVLDVYQSQPNGKTITRVSGTGFSISAFHLSVDFATQRWRTWFLALANRLKTLMFQWVHRQHY